MLYIKFDNLDYIESPKDKKEHSMFVSIMFMPSTKDVEL